MASLLGLKKYFNRIEQKRINENGAGITTGLQIDF